MDSYSFYKSLYDRELNRRKDLDSSITVPTTILTLIVGMNTYFFQELELTVNSINTFTGIELFIIFSNVVSFLLGLFFLIKSYNNLFVGFEYLNFGSLKEIRKYEIIDLKSHNSKENVKEIVFENVIIDKLCDYIDNHTFINDKRTYDLYFAKTLTILALILTGLELILLMIKKFNYV